MVLNSTSSCEWFNARAAVAFFPPPPPSSSFLLLCAPQNGPTRCAPSLTGTRLRQRARSRRYKMGDDNNGECVAHGKNQAFVGLDLQGILDLVDNTAVNGDELHEAFSAAANAGGGWVDYHWANKVGDDPYLKIARIAGVHKFGTSYYLGVGFNHEMRAARARIRRGAKRRRVAAAVAPPPRALATDPTGGARARRCGTWRRLVFVRVRHRQHVQPHLALAGRDAG